MASADRNTLGEALIADDRRYFEAGAEFFATDAFDVYWLPSLRLAPAGCVAYPRDLDRMSVGALDAALAALDGALAARGIGHARFYETGFAEPLRARLRACGYEEAVEIALAVEADRFAFDRIDAAGLQNLVTVSFEDDWQRKLQLHACETGFPDGHAYPTALWVSLERAKVEAGYMEMAMIVKDGVPQGSVGLGTSTAVLRLKNLFVSPLARGLGYGEWLTHYCMYRADRGGFAAFGCFGIEGRAGDRLYRRCGLQPVGRQVGWTKPLVAAQALEPGGGKIELVS